MPSGVPRIPEPREWVLKKMCTNCRETKPWAKFAPRVYWPDGSVRIVAPHCHVCDAAKSARRARDYRERNRERLNAYKSGWKRRKLASLRSDRENDITLPVGPIRGLLRQLLADEEFDTIISLAEAANVDERTIRRLLNEQNRTSLRIVDEITTRLGVNPYELYPELVPEVAA